MKRLEISNISLSIKKECILKDINLSINKGELVSIFGKSGAGKTMLLNGICGIIGFDTGEIVIDNENITNSSIQKRNCVILDQDILLFNHMNVYDNIAFGLRMEKKSKDFISEKVNELALEMGIEKCLNKFCDELSGGEQQRVALARALAINPKLLLLDEPFNKLDMNLRKSMHKLIKKLKAKYELTIVLVTHDKDEALLLSDKIAILSNKTIVDYDTPENIYSCPSCLDTLYLMVNSNILSGNIFDKTNNNKYMVIFYEDIIITNNNLDYSAIITDVNYCGDRFFYELDYNDKIIKGYSKKQLMIGENVNFKINEYNIKYY